MVRVKRRIFSGSVLEQEIFTVHGPDSGLAVPRQRFQTEEDRAAHRDKISRRRHARLVNANFDSSSIYTTLTLDNEHEVHTFQEARRLRDLYIRRLRRAAPSARIMVYMGRGKGTSRIHFHMLSAGVSKEVIAEKWGLGEVIRISPLRSANHYHGKNYGRDYTGLANYLFDHWTPEQGQGSHRWKATKNLRQPEKETPTVTVRTYSAMKPPRAPKGYQLVESEETHFGYQYFKYVLVPGGG